MCACVHTVRVRVLVSVCVTRARARDFDSAGFRVLRRTQGLGYEEEVTFEEGLRVFKLNSESKSAGLGERRGHHDHHTRILQCLPLHCNLNLKPPSPSPSPPSPALRPRKFWTPPGPGGAATGAVGPTRSGHGMPAWVRCGKSPARAMFVRREANLAALRVRRACSPLDRILSGPDWSKWRP